MSKCQKFLYKLKLSHQKIVFIFSLDSFIKLCHYISFLFSFSLLFLPSIYVFFPNALFSYFKISILLIVPYFPPRFFIKFQSIKERKRKKKLHLQTQKNFYRHFSSNKHNIIPMSLTPLKLSILMLLHNDSNTNITKTTTCVHRSAVCARVRHALPSPPGRHRHTLTVHRTTSFSFSWIYQFQCFK